MVCVCCTASFFFLGRTSKRAEYKCRETAISTIPGATFRLHSKPFIFLQMQGLEVECAYKSNGKAPPVAETTDEADNPNVVAHVEAGSPSIVQQPRRRKQEGTMEAREIRGLEIAQSLDVRREGNVWIVPSQSKPKQYTVNLFLQTCTCPDFDAHRIKCKHIYAAEAALRRESGAALPAPEKHVKPNVSSR
jgi:hypothetical protein